MSADHLFFDLQPQHVLEFVETYDLRCSGRFLQLNSYENRVFDVFLEGSHTTLSYRIIAKFYRPHRWSESAITEEHLYLRDLVDGGLTAIAPIPHPQNKKTLQNFRGLWSSLFPRQMGRMPVEFQLQDYKSIGQQLALLHNIGSQKKFLYRATFAEDNHWASSSLDVLQSWVSAEVHHRYFEAATYIFDFLYEHLNPEQFIRIHGDCHRGNLLHNEQNFFFIDFDDCLMGPPIQDFWMLLSGEDEAAKKELDSLLNGYETLRHFDDHELLLLSPLRGFRIISYAAWIASRWKDPSFPRLFPQFNSYLYWVEETEALEKIAWAL